MLAYAAAHASADVSEVGERISSMDATRLLDFETAWPRHSSAKEETIRSELQLTPARYYQLLARAIDTREALEYDPMLTHRLRRIRDQRQQALRSRRAS